VTSTLEPERTVSYTEANGLPTGPIPISGYLSQEYYDREVERIWKRTWLLIGRTCQIPNPGDYFVKQLAFASASILVVRGRDGEVRAFHNVCSHKCAKVVWEERGNLRRLQCGFHGWTYGLDGELVSIPDEECFFDIDKATLGLTAVALDMWEGYVFVNLAPEPPETLEEYLGGHLDKFDGFPWQAFTHEYTYRGEVNCNWKVVRDAFVESYHVPVLHRYSFGRAYSTPENPHNRNYSYTSTKYHGQHSLFINTSYVPTPMEQLAFALSGLDTVMVKPDDVAELMPPGMNPMQRPDWSGENVSVFPSTVLVVFVGFSLLLNFWPLSVDKTLIEMTQSVRPPRNATERWAQEVSNNALQFAVLEDFLTLERCQETMKSGAKKYVYMQDHEVNCRLNHYWVQEIVGPYPA
jgi:phenylpropionate dioxygenase-like ring-hydroxylating dioxygenase large terminal subunit